jgi:hypothetical protein
MHPSAADIDILSPFPFVDSGCVVTLQAELVGKTTTSRASTMVIGCTKSKTTTAIQNVPNCGCIGTCVQLEARSFHGNSWDYVTLYGDSAKNTDAIFHWRYFIFAAKCLHAVAADFQRPKKPRTRV